MCVIAVCELARLTDEQVDQMWTANSFGGGVAWRDTQDGKPIVRWEKDLKKDDMLRLNRELPLPYVLHFRVPSADTSKSGLACHPFAIDEDASFEFEGRTSGFVLFHNGFWNQWRDSLKNIAINCFVRIPSGPWSDSRGLALAAHHLGLGFLELVGEKVVAFGPNEYDIEIFGGWSTIKNTSESGEEVDVLVSNKGWERTVTFSVSDRRHTAYSGQQKALTAGGQGGGAASNASFRGQACGTEGKKAEGPAESEAVSKDEAEAGKRRIGFTPDDTLELSCAGCQKNTSKGQMLNYRFYCFHCWSERIKTSNEPIGLCQTCRVSYAASRTADEDKWICGMCWRTNGKPRIKFTYSNQENYD